MSLSTPFGVFGVHSLTILNATTQMPIRMFKVVGSISIPIQGDFDDLMGGSSRFPWDSEPKTLKSEADVELRQYEDDLFTYMLGAVTTTSTADTAGTVSTLVNKQGTTAFSATIGCATVTVKAASKADLKSGYYIVKAAGATTIDVYIASDADLGAGTAIVPVNDAMKITTSPLTITSGGTTDVPNVGLTITGGSGTIGMTTADTFAFYVNPVNNASSVITIGSSTMTYNTFSAVFMAQKKQDGNMIQIYAPKCKGFGLPISLKEMSYSAASVKIKMFYDSSLDMVMQVRKLTRG